jgi:hypothetical protein
MPTMNSRKAAIVSSAARTELAERFLAGENLHPGNACAIAVGLAHGGVEDAHGGAPDVPAGSVAFDERKDRSVGHVQLAVAQGDPLPARRHTGESVGHQRTPVDW